MKKNLPDNNSMLEEFRPFADVDFIVTDIDGTLVSGSNPVLKQIKRTIKSLQQQRVQLTVATGRTLFGAKSLLSDLGIKHGMPVALYNGGVVLEYGTENILYSRFISFSTIQKLFNILPVGHVTIYIYTFTVISDVFHNVGEGTVIERVYGVGPRTNEYDVNGLKIDWIEETKLQKLNVNAILIEKGSLSEEEKKILDMHLTNEDDLSFTDSGNGFIEIKANGLNKGIIFKTLRKQKKYKVNKILAIGDNDNDRELFQYADISVAVANASMLAMEEADYVCKDISAQGFNNMLNVIKNAKKYFGDRDGKERVR